jgi:hypothetical protein
MPIEDFNPDLPSGPIASMADLRANQQALADAIEALGAPGALDFLPLTGGQLTGPLQLPVGTLAHPALQLGADDGTGLSRVGLTIDLSLQGTLVALFSNTGTFFQLPISMSNNFITNLADPPDPSSALNLRTGDARYAPVAVQDEVQQLRKRIAQLEAAVVQPPVNIGSQIGMGAGGQERRLT